MKVVMKILCFIGGALVLAKLAQVVIDMLYNNYGKRYITTDEVE